MGGFNIKDDRIEIWDGREWKLGPQFSFKVSTANAQAVVDRKNRIILTTNNYGIIVYDPTQGVIKHYPQFKLRERRERFSALLM